MNSKSFDYLVMGIVLVLGVLYWGAMFHSVDSVVQETSNVTVIEKSDLPEGVAVK